MSIGGAASLGSAYGQIVISTGDAEKNIDRLGSAITGLDDKQGLAGKGAQTYAKGLLAIGGAILGGLGLATNTAANFEQRMSAVQSVTSATGAEFDSLREKALQLGKDTQFSATEAALALEELAKAGVSTKDILAGAADGAVALAAAAGVDLPTAATIIANTLNQFQLEGNQAAHVADLLAAAANKSATDVQSLGTQLSYVAGEAHSLNITAEDTIAALAALSDQGMNEKAGSALNQALVSLVAPTDTAKGAIDALGIAVFDNEGKFVGLTSIIEQLAAATQGMNDEQKQAVLNQIFTANGARAMIGLLNTQTDKAKKAGKSWKDYQDAVQTANAAQDAAAARMNNFRGSLEQLKGSIETVFIRVGNTFLGPARQVVDAGTKLADIFLSLPGPLITATAAVLGLSGAVAGLVGGFIFLEPKLRKAKRAFDEVKPALLGIAGPIAAITLGLALLGIAFEKNVGGLRDKLNGWAKEIGSRFAQISGMAHVAADGIKRLMGFHARDAVGISSAVAGIALSFQNLGFSMLDAGDMALALSRLRIRAVQLRNDVKAANKVIGGFFDILWGGASKKKVLEFQKYAKRLFGGEIGQQFTDATINVRRALHELGKAFKETTGFDASKLFSLPQIFIGITDAATRLATFIDQKLLPAIGAKLVKGLDLAATGIRGLKHHLDDIVGTVRKVIGVVGDVAGAIKDDLGRAIDVAASLLTGDFSGAWDSFTGLIQGIFSQTVSVGKVLISVAEWAFGELKSGGSSLWEKFKGWVVSNLYGSTLAGGQGTSGAAVLGGDGQAVPIPSVRVLIQDWLIDEAKSAGSTLAEKVTGFVATAWSGILGAAHLLTGYAVRLGGWVVTEAEGAAGAGLDLASSVVGFLAGAWPAIRDTGTLLLGKAISLGGWVVREGGDIASSLASSVVNFIAGAWPTVRDATTTLYDKVIAIGSWAIDATTSGKLKDDAAAKVKAILDKLGVTVDGWSVSFATPSDDHFSVDTKGIAEKLYDKLTAPLVVDESASGKAQDLGQRLGEAIFGAVVAGFKAFFSMGGPSSGDRQGTVGIDQVLSSFLIGLLDGLSGGDTADKMIARADKWLQEVNDRFVKWFDGIPGRIWGSLTETFSTDRQGTGRPAPDLIDLVAGMIHLGGDAGAIIGKLDEWWSGVSDTISGWWGGISDKISAIFRGVTPATATGAGFSLPSGSGIWTSLIDALTPDLSGIGFPSLPDWVTDPMHKIPGMNTLLSKLAEGADLVQAAWDKIFGINDSEGGHKPKPAAPFDNSDQSYRPKEGYGLGSSAPAVALPDDPVKVVAKLMGDRGYQGSGMDWSTPQVNVKVPLAYKLQQAAGGADLSRNGIEGGASGAIVALLSGMGLSGISGGAQGMSASTPPVTVKVPLTFQTTSGGGDLARNGAEGGAFAAILAQAEAFSTQVAKLGEAGGTGFTASLGSSLAPSVPATSQTVNAITATLLLGAFGAQQAGSGTGGAYANALGGKRGAAGSAASSLVGAALEGMNGGYGQAYLNGSYVGQGYVAGVYSQVNAAYAAGQQLVLASSGGLTRNAEIRSPSRKFFRYGVQTGKGYVLGVNSMQDDARKAGADLLAQPGLERYAGSFPVGRGGASVQVTNHNYALRPEDLIQLMNDASSGAAAANYIREVNR